MDDKSQKLREIDEKLDKLGFMAAFSDPYYSGKKSSVTLVDERDISEDENGKKENGKKKQPHLAEFVILYNPKNRHKRKATWALDNPQGRSRSYTYDELIQCDKVSLDIFWLKDDSLENSENLPDPDILAAEIIEDLRSALAQFEEIQADLSPQRESGKNGLHEWLTV